MDQSKDAAMIHLQQLGPKPCLVFLRSWYWRTLCIYPSSRNDQKASWTQWNRHQPLRYHLELPTYFHHSDHWFSQPENVVMRMNTCFHKQSSHAIPTHLISGCHREISTSSNDQWVGSESVNHHVLFKEMWWWQWVSTSIASVFEGSWATKQCINSPSYGRNQRR